MLTNNRLPCVISQQFNKYLPTKTTWTTTETREDHTRKGHKKTKDSNIRLKISKTKSYITCKKTNQGIKTK